MMIINGIYTWSANTLIRRKNAITMYECICFASPPRPYDRAAVMLFQSRAHFVTKSVRSSARIHTFQLPRYIFIGVIIRALVESNNAIGQTPVKRET